MSEGSTAIRAMTCPTATALTLSTMRLRLSATVVAVVIATAGLAACSQKTTASDDSGAPSASTSATASAATCTPDQLHLNTAGKLTVATDSPAYDPWFRKNDPSNGQGYESAVAYAVAQKLGFQPSDVVWVKEGFNNSYTPGPKKFDFDVNQISITPERAAHVTFSDGYYTADQAIIMLTSKVPSAVTLASLKGLKLGAETATTSLTAIRDDVQPSQQPLVFDTDDQAKQALLHGQIDGLVTDLPSAGYMSSEIPGSTVVGKFANAEPEEFGMLLQQGNPLVTCLDWALGELKTSGALTQLQSKWLSDMESVPVLK
jgi:polar amino acid transport system substrate-binding protein